VKRRFRLNLNRAASRVTGTGRQYFRQSSLEKKFGSKEFSKKKSVMRKFPKLLSALLKKTEIMPE
jgi:hypothetical protein